MSKTTLVSNNSWRSVCRTVFILVLVMVTFYYYLSPSYYFNNEIIVINSKTLPELKEVHDLQTSSSVTSKNVPPIFNNEIIVMNSKKLKEVHDLETSSSVTNRNSPSTVASIDLSSTENMSEMYMNLTLNPYGKNSLDTWMYNYYRTVDPRNATNINQMKYILFWNSWFGDKTMNLGLGEEIFKNCPIKTCGTTINRSLMPVEEFDAVLFHKTWPSEPNPVTRRNTRDYDHPRKRKTNQKYIFYTLESPCNIYRKVYFDNDFYYSNSGFYNWTITTRRDSDIHYPYGLFKRQKTNYTLPTPQDLKTKNITAMWLVSNCHTKCTKTRELYVKRLKKFIKVDILGHCSERYCTDCRKLTEREYFFYLSFENSMCRDYVTEKLYELLQYNVVPVVLGNANYTEVAPPHSVIDTKDFARPRDLAKYLIKVSKNWTLYVEYFQWKKNYVVIPSREYALCQMCEMLHRPIQYSSYDDIYTWYLGSNCNE